jgi:hypothetical protein
MYTETGNAELYGALAKAQGEIVNAAKNAKNPHFKSDYADLASILDTVKPALSKNGIAVFQGTAFDGPYGDGNYGTGTCRRRQY